MTPIAAALLELHKHKRIPFDPAGHGFVFSKDTVERFAQRAALLNRARHIEYVRFHMPPQPPRPSNGQKSPAVALWRPSI